MGYCLLPSAEAELDDIWLYVARASGSIEIANRLIDTITERLFLLGQYPQMGRRRDHDLRPGLRSFRQANTSSSTASKAQTRLSFTSSAAAGILKPFQANNAGQRATWAFRFVLSRTHHLCRNALPGNNFRSIPASHE
jgi:plasmid stabilization system protein ParE